MSKIMKLPQMLRDAEIRADTFDEAARTIEVIWTTGATVRRINWLDGEFDEELIVSGNSVRLGRLNAGAPLLDTHGKWSLADVIGSVVPGSARIEAGKGTARVLLSKSPDAADRVAKIIEGTVRNISVGYRIHAVEKKERAGAIPLHRVTDWEPWEISAVPIPADAGSQFRSGEGGVNMFACRVTGEFENDNTAQRARMALKARRHGMIRSA